MITAFYYDKETASFYDKVGDAYNRKTGYKPTLAYGSKPEWKFTLIGVSLPGITGWRAAVDVDFTSSTDPMCRTTTGIAAAVDDDQNAVVTIPLNAKTARFQQVCDGKQSCAAYMEIAGMDAAGEQILYVCFPIIASYVIDPQAAGTLEPVSVTALTEAQVAAIAQNAANAAFAPTATVTQTDTGATFTVTDKDGTTTANLTNGKEYSLPAATAKTLGGVKVGANLSVSDDGTLSADAQQYTLPAATAETLGGVKVGANLSVSDDGTLSADAQQYTLPAATAETLGGVKVGANLSVSDDGTLSANITGGTSSAPGNAVEHLDALPAAWTAADNGRVFLWTADTIDGSVANGHHYMVTPTYAPGGLSITGFPTDKADYNGDYVPDGTTTYQSKEYTRYKNTNGKYFVHCTSLNWWVFDAIAAPSDPGTSIGAAQALEEDPTSMDAETFAATVAQASSSITSLTATDLLGEINGYTLKDAISPLSGYETSSQTTIDISPGDIPIKVTAANAVTINATGGEDGKVGYRELVLALGASGSISAGTNLVIIDAPAASKTSYCIVRWDGVIAKLYVWESED